MDGGVRVGGAGRQRLLFVRDVAPGEAVFIDLDGRFVSRQCADNPQLVPCIFEYVYFARPDSLIDGAFGLRARLRMGEYLADKVARNMRLGDIDGHADSGFLASRRHAAGRALAWITARA